MWFTFLSVWLTGCALVSVVCLCFKASQSNRLTPDERLIVSPASHRPLLISSVMNTARWPRPASAGGRGDFTETTVFFIPQRYTVSCMIDYLFVENSLSVNVISLYE